MIEFVVKLEGLADGPVPEEWRRLVLKLFDSSTPSKLNQLMSIEPGASELIQLERRTMQLRNVGRLKRRMGSKRRKSIALSQLMRGLASKPPLARGRPREVPLETIEAINRLRIGRKLKSDAEAIRCWLKDNRSSGRSTSRLASKYAKALSRARKPHLRRRKRTKQVRH